jgi:hypothetical protein
MSTNQIIKVRQNRNDKDRDRPTENGVKKTQEVTFSIKSAFMDFAPTDLKIDKSSGQIVQTGKKFSITQYFCPLHCEISYTILVGESRKQCRFVIEILDEGKYSVTLSND